MSRSIRARDRRFVGLTFGPLALGEGAVLECVSEMADESDEEWAEVQALLTESPERGRTVLCEKVTVLAIAQLAGRIRDPNDRDDVAQDVVLSVLRSLPQFDGRSPLRNWVRVIVRNRAIDHFRKTDRLRRREMSGSEAAAIQLENHAEDEERDEGDEKREVLAPFVAFLRSELVELRDPARRAGETEAGRRRRLTRGRVLDAHLAGSHNATIARQLGMTPRAVRDIVLEGRRHWHALAEKRGFLPQSGIPLDTGFRGLLGNGPEDENAKMDESEVARLRELFLGPFPLLDTLDAWEEIFELSAEELRLVRQLVAGAALEELSARGHFESAEAKINAGLAERDYAQKRWLSVYEDKTFDDYRDAVLELPPLQREVLRLVAYGVPYEEVARLKQLEGTARVRTLLDQVDQAMKRRFTRRVHDVGRWIRRYVLQQTPGKTAEEFWSAVEELPEQSARVVRGRAEGKTNAAVAAELGISREEALGFLKTGLSALVMRLASRTPQSDHWLKQYFLALHPGVDAARFWELAEAKLDPLRLRVVKLRHAGRSYGEIATELELPNEQRVASILTSAKATVEEALFEASRAANPFASGTEEAWLWTWILYRHPSVKPDALWATATKKLTPVEVAVMRAKASGKAPKTLARLAGKDTPKNLLAKAQKKLHTSLAPRPPKQRAWVAKVLARHPERSDKDFWAAVATLPEEHRTLARLKVEGASTKDLAAALGVDSNKVPGLVNYVSQKLDRRLAAPAAGGEPWIRSFVLDRFPERSLADFDAALSVLTDDQRRIVALRRAGKSTPEAAASLAIEAKRAERLLTSAQDRIARALAPKAVFDPRRWLADNFLREVGGSDESEFRRVLQTLPVTQRRAIEGAWAGKTHAQMADEDGVPEWRIQGFYYRGRQGLLKRWRQTREAEANARDASRTSQVPVR